MAETPPVPSANDNLETRPPPEIPETTINLTTRAALGDRDQIRRLLKQGNWPGDKQEIDRRYKKVNIRKLQITNTTG